MGVVTEAARLDTGERCAIKFLRDDIESDLQPVARFAREAQLATKLKSPHTCRLIGVGECETGPFIVMELLDGYPLSAILEPSRLLPWRQVVRIIHDACQSLGEAHGFGIVHRDVKPGNIFLAWSSQQRAITKVLDFGVAKIPSKLVTYGGGPSLTDASLLLGTPAYVAPEQLNNSKAVNARADVWALGVLMYEMLARRLPFSSPLVPKLLLMIAREDPPPLASLAPQVPTELVHIVHRCLFKDPSLRFSDAINLGVALKPWLADDTNELDSLLRDARLRVLRSTQNTENKSLPPVVTHAFNLVTEREPPDSLGPHTTSRLTHPCPRRYSPKMALVVGAGIGGLAGLFGLVHLGYSVSQPTAASPSSAQSTSTSSSAEHLIATATLSVNPPEANPTLTLDGVTLPTNPYVVMLPRDHREHVLRAEAPGYTPQERAFRFDTSTSITLVLAPNTVRAATRHPVAPTNREQKRAATSPRNAPDVKTNGVTPTTRPLDKENPF
jgi:serine/threonine protein kinase